MEDWKRELTLFEADVIAQDNSNINLPKKKTQFSWVFNVQREENVNIWEKYTHF